MAPATHPKSNAASCDRLAILQIHSFMVFAGDAIERALAVREKTARLRALRLNKDPAEKNEGQTMIDFGQLTASPSPALARQVRKLESW
jgi:hypothetical protein